VFEEVERMAREENTSRSEVLREALKHYTRTQKLWRQIYRWGEESAKELGIQNEAEVDELVHQFRREQTKT
jgi:metal-responsive CopG/Arc/MetJ family transcriptional regulator